MTEINLCKSDPPIHIVRKKTTCMHMLTLKAGMLRSKICLKREATQMLLP